MRVDRRTCARWRAIETEFDEPLRDILSGMRAQGASWDTIAGALDIPPATLKRWRQHFGLRDGRYIRDLRQAHRLSDARSQALGYADLFDAMRDCRLIRRMTWRETARHLGISVSTLIQHCPEQLRGDYCMSEAGRATLRENLQRARQQRGNHPGHDPGRHPPGDQLERWRAAPLPDPAQRDPTATTLEERHMAPQDKNKRDWQLVGLAMSNDVDSFDLEEACRRQGIDPDTADLRDVDKAIKDTCGQPPPSSWLPWRR